jgi:hypothetical protein
MRLNTSTGIAVLAFLGLCADAADVTGSGNKFGN